MGNEKWLDKLLDKVLGGQTPDPVTLTRQRKEALMRTLRRAKNPAKRRLYVDQINRCDGVFKRLAKASLLVAVLLVTSLLNSGCVEHTMRAVGGCLQAGGRLVTGVGKDVTRAVDGYSEK